MPHRVPEDMPEHLPEDMPEDMPEHLPEDMPGHLPEDMPFLSFGGVQLKARIFPSLVGRLLDFVAIGRPFWFFALYCFVFLYVA